MQQGSVSIKVRMELLNGQSAEMLDVAYIVTLLYERFSLPDLR